MDGAAIPWNALVREFQRGHSAYIAKALEQPLLLPKDMDAVRKLKQQDLFMSLKRDLAMVSSQPHTFYLLSTSHFFLSLLFTWGCYIFFVLITQEVFVAEEWVKEAQNDVKNEVHLRLKTEKALGAAKEENKKLLSKLIVEERERRSVKAGLKNAQTQAKDQHKLLYQTKIELTTLRQLVMELKANLQKAKEAAQLAKEATEVEKQASYLFGIKETQARLTKELAEVCKDYCNVICNEALNVARVPIDLAWRQPRSIYY